jgi:hypothetical protein
MTTSVAADETHRDPTDQATATGLCRAVLRVEGGGAVIRCLAEADASGVCPVHRAPTVSVVTRRVLPPAPSPHEDLLPWSDDVRAMFTACAPPPARARRAAGRRGRE